MVIIKTKFPLFAIKYTDTYYRVHNITDHDGDAFYGLPTLMFHVNPPPMFSRIKFSKMGGGGEYMSKYGLLSNEG
jgi:hypothetical protein